MNKKNKFFLILGICLLSIGFALVTTTLIVNGNVTVGTNQDDFRVIFTEALTNDLESTAEITNDGKNINFVTRNLSKINDEVTLDYEVSNYSRNYNASTTISLTGVTEGQNDYFTFTKTEDWVTNNAGVIDAGTRTYGKITIKLTKVYDGTEPFSLTFSLKININAVELQSLANELIDAPPGTPGLYDDNDRILCKWESCGIDLPRSSSNYKTTPTSAYYVLQNKYPNATKAILPDSLKTLEAYSFAECSNLKSIKLPDTLTTIKFDVFYKCTNLVEIEFPDSVTSISEDTFNGCVNLIKFTIPSAIKIVPRRMFSGCTNLREVIIPDTVTTIQDGAFRDCVNLDFTNLPSALKIVEQYAFCGCAKLSVTSLPDGITSIGATAFAGCINMELTSLPSDLISIGTWAFTECVKMKLTSLPSKLVVIEYGAFGRCTGLTKLTIPNSVTAIGAHAFDGCSNLTEMIFVNKNNWYYETSDGVQTAIPASNFSTSTSAANIVKNTYYKYKLVRK